MVIEVTNTAVGVVWGLVTFLLGGLWITNRPRR